METKPASAARSKLQLFMKLPKAAVSGITFQNPDPFSPRRDVKTKLLKAHQNSGFSGPIIPEVFEEARRNKSDKSSKLNDDVKEPTSPKISCMGQIKKNKKKITKNNYKKSVSLPSVKKSGPGWGTSRSPLREPIVVDHVKVHASGRPVDGAEEKVKKKWGNPRRIFTAKAIPAGRKSDASGESRMSNGGAPPLRQLRKYASSRDTLSSFDWTTAQVTPEDCDDNSRCFSGGGRRGCEEEEDRGVIIPFSAPIMMAEIKPVLPSERQKEINLWKRRTMAQPPPLHLKKLA